MMRYMRLLGAVLVAGAIAACGGGGGSAGSTSTGGTSTGGGTTGGTTTGTGSSVQQNIQKIQSFVDMKLTLEQVVAQNTAGQTIQPEMLATFSLIQVILTWTTIIQAGIISREEAYIEFAESVQADFQQAENLVVTNPDKIQYNILPAAFNLISNGLYSKNKLVTIETICTAVDVSEIQLQ